MMRTQVNDTTSAADSSSTYTLSLVRLAPPEHSFMAELNASVKGSTYSLCSDYPSAGVVLLFLRDCVSFKGAPIGSFVGAAEKFCERWF